MTEEETPSSDVVRRDRFTGGPAREFLSSMDADRRIFAADIAVDRAHVVMLAEQGIVSEDVAGEILAALDEIEAAGHETLPEGEDVHAAIETAVIERVGEDGGKMHTARSRNDEVATCIRYRLREDLLDAIEATIALREQLLETASEHTDTVMPGYTHLQPAQPTTVAHWLCSYEQAIARDTERLLDAYGRVNRSPLGAAAFAGTTFDIDRERTAELLGFESIVENSMDASSTRDFLLESVSALAAHATTLSGIAEDIVVFANRGFVELSDDYASTSSIMPQKKNPDTLELVRATAGEAAAGVNGLLTTLKGLPRAYNRDLQSATPYAWETVDAVLDATDVVGGAVATAEWPEDALADAAGEGFSTATGVADLLAANGLPFRTAHEVVAVASEDGGDFDAIDAAAREVLDAPLAEYVDPDAVEAALDPAESVASRDSVGGPAPAAVEASLGDANDQLAADQDVLADRRDALATGAALLDDEVSSYA
ncbi:argininosuccinate lyase [Natranaeroarchaeum sulfidigenes]|uniref:Argininosuccinate lyase n=1 Tax=Natranaeroarchaeum sulfidigenes TaxID=2784880 RepID=A0A897N1N9_9EURY|nr:argininosuccinate lyase [Natranaeroarchaeum sulfidigenes]QSG04246.1 Argininosuccinate lyase [Natranaeroarchaeum sulfidigenes]